MAGRAGTKRYVVMPGTGIAGAAMEAAVFKDGAGPGLLADMLASRTLPFLRDNSNVFTASVPPASSELAAAIGEADFEVLSQRFQDGPAVVRMTEEARLALEASAPDLRVFPITQYYLPGQRPMRGKKGAAPASQPAAESAVQDDGTIFMDDLKQHYLGGADGGRRGEGVLIGILDTGIDAQHPALAGKVSTLRCYIPGAEPAAGGPVDWGPQYAARAGHGTHVAGIIAAANGQGGPAGVAPDARLNSYRIFPDSGTGPKRAENAVIINSIRAAVDDGCDIINLSVEGPNLKEDGVRSAIAYAWSQGVVCVAAAGNGFGNPVSAPASLPHCVAVTAIGRDGAFPATEDNLKHVSDQRATSDEKVFLAKFSNFGPPVQFTAPGHAIVSTFPGGEWWISSGTSMAAPFVTGVLARLLSDNENILNAFGDAERSGAMLQMLVGRARRLGLPQTSYEGYGLPV